jgi:hypothetical protein
MSTTSHGFNDGPDIRDLAGTEPEQVSGGMKWTRGTKNPDVIDARGGTIRMGGIIATFDIDGDVSSISGPKG